MSRKQGKQAISQEEITWINSANDKSAAAFIKKFELNEKLTAHYRYRLLIETTTNISKTDRNRLLNEFDWWKNNKGQQFWADRQIHLSTMRTSVGLAGAAEPYVKQSFRRNATWNELNQQQGMYFAFNRCFQLRHL